MVKGEAFATNISKQSEVDRQFERQEEIGRLQELESASTSTPITESTESFLSIQEVSEEEENLSDILDDLYDTDNESIQEEELEYIQSKAFEEETDFFQGLSELPDVDNISADISVAAVTIEKTETLIDPTKDAGKFVNPLTGVEIRYIEESASTADEADAEVAEAVGEEEYLEDADRSDEDEVLLADDIFEVDDELKKIDEVEDTLEIFFELQAQKEVVAVEDIDWHAVAREEEAQRLHQNTQDFITELISKAVDTVEYVSPETILRHQLDKRKLMKELSSKHTEYGIEKSVCLFLNRKIVEYFRRKKTFRPIMQDNPKTLTQDKLKFKEATQCLDHLLGKESKLHNSTTMIINDLRGAYEEAKELAETQVQLFESTVKKNLFRENRPKSNVLIEHLLTKMHKYRQEVNDVRFVMFTKQHTQAKLMEQLAKLEDLGNGLSMRDFGTLQAETQTLGKKIEERNAELNKLHIRCRSDIHTMAHYKEKQKMLRNSIYMQRSILESLLEDKSWLRERLYNLKLSHKHVRAQIKELSFQGGLLDKPALLLDYDATVVRLRKQHETVDHLKKSLLETQYKIDEIVKQCPAV